LWGNIMPDESTYTVDQLALGERQICITLAKSKEDETWGDVQKS